MPNKIPDKADFEKAKEEFFRESEEKGYRWRDLKASELFFRTAKEYPNENNNRVPLCCKVMRENMQLELGDKKIYEPPGGDGTRLEIRYVFPRPRASRNVKAAPPAPPAKSFTIECAYCNGTGIDPGDAAGQMDCRACGGSGSKTLEGSRDDYETCRRCKGTGRDRVPSLIMLSDPCKKCDGSGLSKIP
jgi:hypothetical protein